MMTTRIRKLAAILCASALALAGCSTDEEKYAKLTPQEIYDLGQEELDSEKPEEAAEIFEEVERLHPYSEWARRGTIMAAYSYGLAEEYEKSRSAAERFLASYPGDESAAYAQYLIALSYYDQLDGRGRDQANTQRALEELKKVTEEYADSEYAPTAELQYELTVDHLAAKDMEVGRYYLKRMNYAAALNRFQNVVENFDTTSQVPEALHRMVEAFLGLGLITEAREAAGVLAFNFRGSEWYQETYDLFTERGITVPEGNENLIRQFYRRTIRGDWI